MIKKLTARIISFILPILGILLFTVYGALYTLSPTGENSYQPLMFIFGTIAALITGFCSCFLFMKRKEISHVENIIYLTISIIIGVICLLLPVLSLSLAVNQDATYYGYNTVILIFILFYLGISIYTFGKSLHEFKKDKKKKIDLKE